MVAFFAVEEQDLQGARAKLAWRFGKDRGLAVKLHCLGSATFLEAVLTLPRGCGPALKQKRLRGALADLAKRGVYRVAADPALYSHISAAGLLAANQSAAWGSCAHQVVQALLQSRGLDHQNTLLCIHANKLDRQVLRCAQALAPHVRYLSTRIQVGGEYLEQMLYEEYGIASQQSVPPEFARLDVAFPGAEVPGALVLDGGESCEGFSLLAPEWARAEKPAGVKESVFAALLLESGLIRPQEVRVTHG